MLQRVRKAADYIQNRAGSKPEIGLVLGSGLGVLAEELSSQTGIPYREIPDFPISTVEGHAGRMVLGELEGQQVAVMQGRFHYYEGYSLQEVTLPIRTFGSMGIKTLIVTNAAGGINRNFNPGELMLISDHLNLMGGNPLRGKNEEEFGVRFPDMTEAYNRELLALAQRVGESEGILTRKGIYAGLSGPSYETPAEIRYLNRIGADAVGMSTVPEVIVANQMGVRVLGISCITNMAAGILPEPLNHEEVMETAARVRDRFIGLIRAILKELRV